MTGVFYKKGSGQGFFHRQNWKRRAFQLTHTELNYYDIDQATKLRGTLDLTSCSLADLQVMPADCKKTGRTPATQWRVAIQTPSRRFVFAAETENEMQKLVQALQTIFEDNERYLLHGDDDSLPRDNSFNYSNRYLERLSQEC
ncbi:hypothetical protein LEN26_003775 [Aphanomyces euteiches]|nr:hypothetical protein LEN26_003775 [Aphanomyces euteiches]